MTPHRLESAARETGTSVLPWIYTAFVAAYGGSNVLFSTFLALLLCDWALALLATSIQGERVCWEKAVRGFKKTLAYLILLIALHRVDVASPLLVGICTEGKIMDTTLIGLAGYELWSILRNTRRCGIEPPEWLSKIAERLRNVTYDNNRGGN